MFRNNTIKMHFIRNFIIAMLIPFTMSGILQSIILFQNAYNNIISNSHRSIAKADSYFNLVVRNTENLANIVSYDKGIQQVLLSDFILSSASEHYYLWKESRNILISNFISYDNILSNAIIFNKKGKVVLSLYRFDEYSTLDEYEWKDILEDTYGQGIWIPAHIDSNDFNAGQEYVITLAKKIRMFDSEQIGDDLGYLVINLRERYLHEMLNNFVSFPNSTFFVLNEDNNITIHQDNQQIGQLSNIKLPDKKTDSFFTRIDGKNVLISFIRNQKTGWLLVEVLSASTIFANSIKYMLSTFFVNIALLIVFILFSIKISNTISKPICELQAQMELVEKGIFKFDSIRKSNILEIDRLIKRFGIMVQRLNDLIEEVFKSRLKEKELEIAVNRAELISLQQQINPHFLYNTLDTINWMAMLGSKEEVSTMVTSLSDFFRFSINHGLNFVTIASEIENTKNYIYLQQVRFGPALVVEIDVQPEIYDCLTMKLLLQPIVENAILHGIQAKSGGGKIIIRLYKEDNLVVFYIHDNGVGMDQETIDRILSPDMKQEKIGLRNVIQRLSLLFHDKYTFKIDSHLNEGTTITVSIPCFYSEDELADIIQ